MRCPRIFYFCFSHQTPTGGQKHAYRHVDILNAYGYEAYLFHTEEGFRLEWFEHDTRVIGPGQFNELYDSAIDYVVVPEDLGLHIHKVPGRIVIFDRGVFRGLGAFGFDAHVDYPALSPKVVAALTVSDHNRAHLALTYPRVPVYRVYSEIRPDVFAYRELCAKKPLVASVLKAGDTSIVVHHMIRARGAAGFNQSAKFDWVFLEGYSERQTAAILQDALIFVSTGIWEGLPRLPREALSCGCIVATSDAGPLRECIPRPSRFECGNLVPMVEFIEAVMASYPDNVGTWAGLVEEGRAAARRYSVDRQERSVLDAWNGILGGR